MGDIERAMDLRDELPVVCSTPKVLSKFVAGTYDFSEAYDAAVRVGGDCAHLRTVKKFRGWVTRPTVEEDLLQYEGKIRNTVVFELGKIESRVHHLRKKLENS